MRSRLLILAMVLVFCVAAKAIITATNLRFTSDSGFFWSNSTTNVNTLDTGAERASAGVVKFLAGGPGAATIAGVTMAMVSEDHVAGDTLTAVETMSIHTNAGAGGSVTLILPDAAKGTVFWFVRVAAFALVVDPGDNNHFVYSGGTMTDGKYLSLDSSGAKIAVVADASANWVLFYEHGTLTEE